MGGPIFDLAKLKWLNGRYLREKLHPEEVVKRLQAWKANSDFIGKIMPLALQRLETFSDFFPLAQFLLSEQPDYGLETLTGKLQPDQPAKLLKIAEWELEKASPWNRDTLSEIFQKIADMEEIKLKQLMPLFFVAMSGTPVSLPLFDGLSLLGPDLARMRLRRALELLGESGNGLSKKGLKSLEKYYASRYGNRID